MGYEYFTTGKTESKSCSQCFSYVLREEYLQKALLDRCNIRILKFFPGFIFFQYFVKHINGGGIVIPHFFWYA